MSAASSATASAEESRATRLMMGKLMAKFDAGEATDRAKLPTCSAAAAEGPKPMFPKFVTLADHDTVCPFLGVGTRSDAKTKVLRERISEQGGLEFEDWWSDLGKFKTDDQWRKKLASLGVPEGIFTEATRDRIGEILFGHIDDDCRYSEEPLSR